jgi:hypothetical protein
MVQASTNEFLSRETMKALLLLLALATTGVFAQTANQSNAGIEYLFRDPLRKVKNANGELVNADLRPLFTWYQNRRGTKPMAVWGRFGVTVIESKDQGLVVSNNSDGKVFFIRNYPRPVPPKTVMQVFAVDDGIYSYKDSSGNKQDVHAYNYGVVSGPTAEKKAAAPKK